MEVFDNKYNNKKSFIYNMTKYKDHTEKYNVKKKCINALREYNKSYKYEIVNNYRCVVEIDHENRWNAMPPKYYEMVVGYLIHNNNIIPYTEASSIATIHNVLLNDVRFNFVGDKDDLDFQYVICFLTSVGVVVPRDDNGEPLFEVVSLFNGATKRDDIEAFASLTHFIQHRSTPCGKYGNTDNYGFDFNLDNIIRKDDYRLYNENRIKLTLKSLGEVLASNKQNLTPEMISSCIIS
jgi:hypothetical protein